MGGGSKDGGRGGDGEEKGIKMCSVHTLIPLRNVIAVYCEHALIKKN